MSDDVTEPAPQVPPTPPRRRQPSQSDIHGISTIATVPPTSGRDQESTPPAERRAGQRASPERRVWERASPEDG